MGYNIEHIKWLDSYGCTSTWRPIEPIETLMECETVGFVVSETEEIISLANSISYETEHTHEQANGIMTIVKKCIIKRKKLN
jgi:hypothetical protein